MIRCLPCRTGPFQPSSSSRPGCRTRAAFTLVELVVTLAILSVLALIAVPVAELAYKRTKEQELRYSLRQIREGIDAYKRAWDEGRIARKADETGYPPRLEVLVEGVEDLRHPKKVRIYFLRRIPTDPFAPPGKKGAESWGVRSYASPPDDPRPGDDVYDVFSLNTGVGINEVPYREW